MFFVKMKRFVTENEIIKTIPIIAKNSKNLINVFGSFTSPSIKKPKIVIPIDTIRMLRFLLLIILSLKSC